MPTMTKRPNDLCQHDWLYDHTLYNAPQGVPQDRCSVHRQCSKCRMHQMAITRMWRYPYAGSEMPNLIRLRKR